jgi:hypothetical protein
MKNTALQDAIDNINYSNINEKLFVIDILTELMEKEKQDLIDAHYEGQKECSNEFAMESDAILYFKETFKQ